MEQFEVGLKGEHFDQRLATSMALYRIEDVNRAIADPDHPDASIAAGKVRSQGLEAELTGRITPRWNITAGYGYNTTKVLRASPEQEGKPLMFDDGFAEGFALPGVVDGGVERGLG